MRHELHDEVSLEIGRRVAATLRAQPELVQIARDNLARWLEQNADAPALVRCYREWQVVLNGPVSEICRILETDNEQYQRLRQNSPFVGIVSPREIGRSRRPFASDMQRAQLEHIIRAATAITGAQEFVVVGSQAILGTFPEAPTELLVSIEADLFTLRNPADAGSIGEGSPFHQAFGYYAHGVGLETAVLPAGWRERLVSVHNANTGGGRGLCLEIHDLAVSKLVAGREKDMEFVQGLFYHKMADRQTVRERLTSTPLDAKERQLCVDRLK